MRVYLHLNRRVGKVEKNMAKHRHKGPDQIYFLVCMDELGQWSCFCAV